MKSKKFLAGRCQCIFTAFGLFLEIETICPSRGYTWSTNGGDFLKDTHWAVLGYTYLDVQTQGIVNLQGFSCKCSCFTYASFSTFHVVGPENCSKTQNNVRPTTIFIIYIDYRKVSHWGSTLWALRLLPTNFDFNFSRKMAIVSDFGVIFHPESIGNIGLGGTSRI